MATETLFLAVPGTNAVIAWSHIVEAHYFPVPDEVEPDEVPRTVSLLVLTMDVQAVEQVPTEGPTLIMTPALTLRFRGPAADRMWQAILSQTYGC